jgi:hypothetical protein
MLTRFKFLSLGLLVSILAAQASAALSKPTTLLGKILFSSVKGDVTCISDGRIWDVKKGDTFQARGLVLRTGDGAHATIVFSNGTGVYADEKTNLEVVKFDQEFFAPNNNLRVEPSNSSTIVKLDTGRVVISTPRLISGTTMVYETAHAAVGIRGNKIMVEASEQQTHVAIIEGLATVNVRDPEGNFVSIGRRLTTGKEAFVKRALGGSTDEKVAALDANAANPTQNDKPGTAGQAKTPAGPPAPAPVEVTKDVEAVVLKLTGSAHAKSPGQVKELSLEEGSKIGRGTTLSVDDESEVQLEPYEGAIATLLPKTTILVEALSITTAGDVIKKQTSLLALKAGSVVSTIDPAKRAINDYGIRTPKGIASAKGTSFVVALKGEGFSVSSTADTVSFLIPDGTVYQISAGNVSVSAPGSAPQPPVSIASALAANPELASTIQSAFATVAKIVRLNIGGFSPESATNLLAKVANVAATAFPAQATTIVATAITAVSSGTSATSKKIPAAVAAITEAVVRAAPTQAAQIATSAATTAPAQIVAVAAAAAKASPTQATQIASAMIPLFIQTGSDGAVSSAAVQTAAALAAAITKSVPDQAPSIASTVMRDLSLGARKSTALANASNAATIAAATTEVVPAQGAPIASAMMKTLSQTPSFSGASQEVVARSAATLASAVTVVVPEQAQKVATAVMQLILDFDPKPTAGAIAEISGTLSGAVAHASPEQAAQIFEGVAGATHQSVSTVQASAVQFQSQIALVEEGASRANQMAALSDRQANGATQSLTDGEALVRDIAAVGGGFGEKAGDDNHSTSIIVTQFDPTEINKLTSDVGAAEAAQSEVQFNTGPNGAGGFTVFPVFTTPGHTPPDFVVSPARLGK